MSGTRVGIRKGWVWSKFEIHIFSKWVLCVRYGCCDIIRV